MKHKTSSFNPLIIGVVLGAMTRGQLRNIAHVANVPRGKDKSQTIANLTEAVEEGKLEFKALCTLQLPSPNNGTFNKRPLLIRKLRSYKPEKNLLVASPNVNGAVLA